MQQTEKMIYRDSVEKEELAKICDFKTLFFK